MRIDVVTIFPDYLAPLELSLPGKARDKGLLDLEVHDLRQWTDDRHRTVDDTPYGGGAGMVMKPEPWGQALDAVAAGSDDRLHHTERGALHAGARPRAERAGAPRLRLRALRGHRPAGHRARRHPRHGAGGVARRLRPQRGRGRRAGHHRGGRAPAARLHGQRRVAGRGVARRRAARVPRLHQAGLVERARRPRGAAVGRPRADRRLAPRAGRAPHRRPPSRPAAARRRSSPRSRTSTYAPRSPPTPASSTRCSVPAGCRRWRPTRGSTSRRCASRSTTYAAGWGSGP